MHLLSLLNMHVFIHYARIYIDSYFFLIRTLFSILMCVQLAFCFNLFNLYCQNDAGGGCLIFSYSYSHKFHCKFVFYRNISKSHLSAAVSKITRKPIMKCPVISFRSLNLKYYILLSSVP